MGSFADEKESNKRKETSVNQGLELIYDKTFPNNQGPLLLVRTKIDIVLSLSSIIRKVSFQCTAVPHHQVETGYNLTRGWIHAARGEDRQRVAQLRCVLRFIPHCQKCTESRKTTRIVNKQPAKEATRFRSAMTASQRGCLTDLSSLKLVELNCDLYVAITTRSYITPANIANA